MKLNKILLAKIVGCVIVLLLVVNTGVKWYVHSIVDDYLVQNPQECAKVLMTNMTLGKEASEFLAAKAAKEVAEERGWWEGYKNSIGGEYLNDKCGGWND